MQALVLIATLILTSLPLSINSGELRQASVYVCSMHPEVQSSRQGKCPKCNMELVREVKATIARPKRSSKTATPSAPQSDAEAYTCAMHPEIRTATPGKCPKCGMALVPTVPPLGDDFDLTVDCTPPAPRPNEKVRLLFSVFNPRTGKQARDFQVMHDQLFHLFIVSQDLNVFQHIHPDRNSDGSFSIETVLPKPGLYKLYADFYPAEGIPQVLQASIATVGYKSDLVAGKANLQADTTLVKTVDGIKIELTIAPEQIIGGQPVTLKYHLVDATTGAPVRDLQPYLAAWGHTLILSDDQSDYVHSHPEQTLPFEIDSTALRGGPDVTFDAFLPRPGFYRIWSQFQRGNKLTTVSFTIKANKLG